MSQTLPLINTQNFIDLNAYKRKEKGLIEVDGTGNLRPKELAPAFSYETTLARLSQAANTKQWNRADHGPGHIGTETF